MLLCILFCGLGRGFDLMLKDILLAEIMPIVEEFDLNTNEGNFLQ